MNSQHTIDSIRLLATSCLISLITITYLTSSIKGSNAKTDSWSSAYNQRPNSDLTGSMRELTSMDNNDDVGTRYHPPLDKKDHKAQPIAEGYRLASTELISPAISVSLNKEILPERHKRDVPFDNTTTSTILLQSAISVNTEPISTTLSNNVSDDEPILSDADENSWALSLSLASAVDGSGTEFETTTEEGTTVTTQIETTTVTLHETEQSTIYSLTSTSSSISNATATITEFLISTTEATSIVSTSAYVTEQEFNNTSVSETSFTLVSSASTTITSLESTQTEEIAITGTEIPITSSTTTTSSVETETISTTEGSTTSEELGTTFESESTVSITVSQPSTVIQSTITTSESELTSLQSTLSTLTTIQTTSTISLTSELVSEVILTTPSTSLSATSISSETPSITEIETSATTESTVSTSFIETSTQTSQEQTVFDLIFNYTGNGGRRKRDIPIGSPPSSTLENEIAEILYNINITCNSTCIQIVPSNDTTSNNVVFIVTLNKLLIIAERIELVDGLFSNNITLNSSYVLGVVAISMNLSDSTLVNFTVSIPLCKECEFAGTGNCSDNDTECTCIPGYYGLFCRFTVPTSISTSTTTLSTTTTSSAQTGEILTGTTATFTESSSITSESSTIYSTSATITTVTETIATETASITLPASSSTESEISPSEGTTESSTLGTSFSATSTATSTLFSPTNTEIIENTSATAETVEATETTTSTLTTTTGTASETETVETTSLPTVTIESTLQVTAEISTSSSTTASTVTAETISLTTTSTIIQETVTSETSSTTTITETGSSLSTTTSTISSTTTTGITEVTVISETSTSTTITGITSTSSTTIITGETSTSTTVTGITSTSSTTTITGETSTSTTVTGITSTSSTTTITGETSTSTTITGITSTSSTTTITGETSTSTTVTGITSTSSTTTITGETSTSTTITGITSTSSTTTITGETSTSTTITGITSTSSTTTLTGETSTSTTVTGITSTSSTATITGETSTSTTITGITSTSSTTTLTGETSTSTTVTGITSSSSTTTITGETSTSTTITGITSTSSTTTITGETSTSTTITGITSTSSTTTLTGETSTSTTVTGITSSSSTTTITGETSTSTTITGITSTSSTTITGETSTSTTVTGITSSSSTTTITGETSTSTTITGITSTSSTTTITGETSTSITVTGITSTSSTTITGETSTSTTITGITSSSSTTTITGETSTSTTVTGITSSSSTTTITGETSTSTTITGITSTSSTTTITGETSTSTTVTGITSTSSTTITGETSTSTTVTGITSTSSTTITGETSTSTTITGITSTSSTTTITGETSTSTTITGITSTSSTTITGETSTSTTITGITGSSSTTTSTISSITTVTSSTAEQTVTGESTTITTFTQTTSATTSTESATSTSTTEVTSSLTSTSSTTTIATSTTQVVTTTVSSTTATTMSTTTTSITQSCSWTNWVAIGNCTPSCGIAYQLASRSCINPITSQSCDIAACGGGNTMQNESCAFSPPCPTVIITPVSTNRDPQIQLSAYQLPNSMYFFGQSYSRIWITNKGYITFDTPYYGATMTSTVFGQLYNQAVAAPFWADLTYDTTSNITINWLSSLNASQADVNTYYPVIQRTVNDACPAQYCSQTFEAVQLIRINWTNLYYQPPNGNQPIAISFAAYLINTYETPLTNNSYPILRSYLSFDYSTLPNNLGYLRPFVGYRGKSSFLHVVNDPSYYQNAVFLTQASYQSFYVGGRYLTQCEVNYLQETSFYNINPSENLNNVLNNPRNPCPCSLGQAQSDSRFSRLYSETSYETSQGVVCYGPLTTSWISSGGTSKPLKTQTCCYDNYGGLITYGALAGSVLSDPSIVFKPYPWQRRIPFHDSCCSPTFPSGQPNWNTCGLYYQLNPESSCTGYQPPTTVIGIGDPHINTIDNGRYTCHIQGFYIFARTTTKASTQATNNANANNLLSDSNLLYPDDLFYVYVQSVAIPPALPYVERVAGESSIFTSYIVGAANYTFVISNVNGRFGFTASNSTYNSSLTAILSINLNADYINTNDTNQRYIYRIQQANTVVGNLTVPQLVFSIWSGLTVQCQIMNENLNCILLLPKKYFTYIEGLAGNFNGNYSDDLFNLQTNQTVLIYSAVNGTVVGNDSAILAACRSWKVPNDTTPDITNPIMPIALVNWYYTNSSTLLTSLNTKLSQTLVNGTCSSNFECVHDYVIRINPLTSAATLASLNAFQQSRVLLAQIPAAINITSPVIIELPYNITNRAYSIPISVTGATSTVVTINTTGTIQTSNFNNLSITIPMVPDDNSSYVEISLNMTYGINSTTTVFLNIIGCFCGSSTNCDFTELTTISPHYQLAACTCLPEYDGVFCQMDYNGCGLTSACRINWEENTTCIPLNATDQIRLEKSYLCNGTCLPGYNSTNDYTCDDIDECTDLTICGNGMCLNTIGSYTCICPTGYQFGNGTCVDIDECTERYVNGNYTGYCGVGQYCTNTIGSFTCTCDSIFSNNTNGSCIFDPSLCQGDTCRALGSSTVTCIYGAVNMGNTCVPWCASTCPDFCQLVGDFYQCNCSQYPGFQPSDYGTTCSQCGSLNYGYGCAQSCQCNFGTCNPNGTNANNSCICGRYQAPTCSKRIDICALSQPCNPSTEDCQTNPITGNATCTCKVGYGQSSPTATCTDINECVLQEDQCDPDTSICFNTIGSYLCNCLPGYESVDGSCMDIDECTVNATICSIYNNTFCTNTPGSYECRCNANYSLGGDYTQIYGDARSSNLSCLPTNYSPFCQNQCLAPASCSSTTGQCECPSSSYNLITDPLDNTLQTCQCPGHPFVYYNGSSCVNVTGQTWFLLNYGPSLSRTAVLNTSDSVTLENQISAILLSSMNITCGSSCVTIYDTQEVLPPSLQLLVALNVPLNISQRLQLSNEIWNQSLVYNTSYSLLAVQINLNPLTPNIYVNLTSVQPQCMECEYDRHGTCNLENTDCDCYQNYTGYLCRDLNNVVSLGQSQAQAQNWTIIVAVVSAVAGLLLIISLVMCVFYCISKRRESTTITKPSVNRQQFTIPRAHVPTMGTVSRELNSWDGFSLDNTYDEQFVDASDSFPSSSSTSYNTTYRASVNRPEADFGIFDELENRTPMPKGHIPRPQMVDMLGTLNSFPAIDQFDDPSGGTSVFSETRDLDEIELVTDMLDDMTKDDDIEDEFVEALNPNLAIPRLSVAPSMASSNWFSFFRNS